jgi:hypothetical protein
MNASSPHGKAMAVRRQMNQDQSWKLAKDILVGEASIISSQEAQFFSS